MDALYGKRFLMRLYGNGRHRATGLIAELRWQLHFKVDCHIFIF